MHTACLIFLLIYALIDLIGLILIRRWIRQAPYEKDLWRDK